MMTLILLGSGCSKKATVRDDGMIVSGGKLAHGTFVDERNTKTYRVIRVENGVIMEEILFKNKKLRDKKLFSVIYEREDNAYDGTREVRFFDTRGEEFLYVDVEKNRFIGGYYLEYDEDFRFTGNRFDLRNMGDGYTIGVEYMTENFEAY